MPDDVAVRLLLIADTHIPRREILSVGRITPE